MFTVDVIQHCNFSSEPAKLVECGGSESKWNRANDLLNQTPKHLHFPSYMPLPPFPAPLPPLIQHVIAMTFPNSWIAVLL